TKDKKKFTETAEAGPNKVAGVIYEAVQKTYAWMYNQMLPALERGLSNQEVGYYTSIAAKHHTQNAGKPDQRLHPDWDAQPENMQPVYTAAEQNTDRIMGKYNFRKP